MFRIALIQMIPDWNFNPESCKESAKACVREMVAEAAEGGAKFACLPEMWNCPYATRAFEPFAEEKGGDSYTFMADLAREYGVYLIGGTIAEHDKSSLKDGKPALYNTCFVFDPSGNEIARHRKVHLFGINIPGRKPFDENDSFLPGDGPTIFETQYGKIGLAVCFDMRFPELLIEEAMEGAELIFAPASFGLVTGKAHWKDLIRMRAIDTQCFFAAVNNSRTFGAKYETLGHSCAFDPWGEPLLESKEEKGVYFADIDLARIREVRDILPVMKTRMREKAGSNMNR